jgi:hypothetical protein
LRQASTILDAKCLADQNGGLYVAAETGEDLVEALDKTLGFGHATTFATEPQGLPRYPGPLSKSRASRQRAPGVQ